MRVKSKLCGSALGLVMTSMCLGCGTGSELAQVKGVVERDGKPVKNLSIEFIPVEGRPSLARTNDLGEFTAFYLPKQPGAAPGKHRLVSEFAQAGPDDAGIDRPRGRGRGQGGALVLSPAEIDVVPGEENTFQLELVDSK